MTTERIWVQRLHPYPYRWAREEGWPGRSHPGQGASQNCSPGSQSFLNRKSGHVNPLLGTFSYTLPSLWIESRLFHSSGIKAFPAISFHPCSTCPAVHSSIPLPPCPAVPSMAPAPCSADLILTRSCLQPYIFPLAGVFSTSLLDMLHLRKGHLSHVHPACLFTPSEFLSLKYPSFSHWKVKVMQWL